MSYETARFLSGFIDVVFWIVLVRVLLSWVIRDPSNPIARFVGTLTDPLLSPLSRVLTFGGIDFSPMVVLIGLRMVQRMILQGAV